LSHLPDQAPSAGIAFQVRASLDAVGAVLRNRDLARLEIGWTASVAADWAYVVTVMVTAYRANGALAVGGVGVVRMLVATVTAPLVSGLAGRFRSQRLLVAIDIARIAAVGIAALVLGAGGPPIVMLAAVAVEAGAFAAIRPIQTSMLPGLARSPAELVAANLASSTGESLGLFVGPALGGFAVAAAGPVQASIVTVAIVGVGLLAILPIPAGEAHAAAPGESMIAATLARLRQGARVIAREPAPRVVVAGFAAQTIVRGTLTVLVVVAAMGLLGVGESGVGILNSAIGLGGFVGAIGSVLLVGRARLAGPFAVALVLWGLPIVAIGIWPTAAIALSALVIVGAANAALDIAGFTLLQRTSSNQARAAVFGLLEGVVGLGVAAGSMLGPPLVAGLGVRVALVATGAILPVTAAIAWRALASADDAAVVPARELALLRSLPMFRPLPLTTLEQAACRMTSVQFAPGDLLTEQGRPGDAFYLIEAGTVDVEQDGRLVRSLEAPSAVGEIALLRHVPRTATVRATTPITAFVLDGPDFIAAVSARPESAAAADRVIAERLAQG